MKERRFCFENVKGRGRHPRDKSPGKVAFDGNGDSVYSRIEYQGAIELKLLATTPLIPSRNIAEQAWKALGGYRVAGWTARIVHDFWVMDLERIDGSSSGQASRGGLTPTTSDYALGDLSHYCLELRTVWEEDGWIYLARRIILRTTRDIEGRPNFNY